MFQRILLPLDLSEKHQAALETAARLAKEQNGEVILLHVIEVVPGLAREEEPEFYERLQQAAAAHLKKHGDILGESGVRCRAEIVFGHRASTTVVFAKEQRIDLVVLTCPAFDPKKPEESMGSLSWRMGLLAPCPVLFVK